MIRRVYDMYNEQITQLLIKAQNGDKDVLQKIVQENQGLIWGIVKRFSGRGYPSGHESAIVSTGNLFRRHFSVRSLSARKAANSPSLPEVESI